ncbi:MAG: metallophosphoesterase [Pseudomonadota bacterium]
MKTEFIDGFTIPENMRVYAIGDVHGYHAHLVKLHEFIEDDIAHYPIEKSMIVYLGDYVNRGPDSSQVVDTLIQYKENPNIETRFLLGNHENGVIEFLKDPEGKNRSWYAWPDEAFLKSYEINPELYEPYKLAEQMQKVIPKKHIEFMETCQLYELVGDFLFVHSGMRPGVSLDSQDRADLFNTREPFMSCEERLEYYVVHGHTSTDDFKVDKRMNRMNLDTGLFKGGPLSCGVFESNTVRLIDVKYDQV